MKKLILMSVISLSLIGCNSDDSSSQNGTVESVSILQNKKSEHGIFVADTATVIVESNGDVSTRAVNWKVDGVLVGTGNTYKLQNKDWRKQLEVCVLFDGMETCSESLDVLPQHPISSSQPIQYAY